MRVIRVIQLRPDKSLEQAMIAAYIRGSYKKSYTEEAADKLKADLVKAIRDWCAVRCTPEPPGDWKGAIDVGPMTMDNGLRTLGVDYGEPLYGWLKDRLVGSVRVTPDDAAVAMYPGGVVVDGTG